MPGDESGSGGGEKKQQRMREERIGEILLLLLLLVVVNFKKWIAAKQNEMVKEQHKNRTLSVSRGKRETSTATPAMPPETRATKKGGSGAADISEGSN